MNLKPLEPIQLLAGFHVNTEPLVCDAFAIRHSDSVLGVCDQFLANIRQAGTFKELADRVSQGFHEILPNSCLSIWVWDAVKQKACKLFSKSWETGHAKFPELLDVGHPISDWLAMEDAGDGQVLHQKSKRLRQLACARSPRIAHIRIRTQSQCLMFMACVPQQLADSADATSLYIPLLKMMVQAAIQALERVHLRTERDLLTDISNLANQSGNRKEFLDKTAQKICDKFAAQGCSIFLYDKTRDKLVLGGTTGIFDPSTGKALNSVDYERGKGFTGWIWKHKRAVRLIVATDQLEWLEVDPTGELQIGTKSAEAPLKPGARGPFLGMPIFHGEPHESEANFVGLIRLHDKTDGVCFVPFDEVLLSAVSNVAAPAILHWNATEELQKAHVIEDGLIDIIESCYLETDLNVILHTIVVEALRIFDAYSACILLKDPFKDWLKVEEFEGIHTRKPETIEFGFDHGLCGDCARLRQTLMVPDVKKDSRYFEVLPLVKSEACTPIVFENELLGVLNIDSVHVGEFRTDDGSQRRFLEILAKQAALAIHRTRLKQESDELHQNLIRTTELLTASSVASGLAHEFKNGLAVIDGAVGNLLLDSVIRRNPETVKTVQRVKQRAGDLFTLTSHMLDLTKTGDTQAKPANLNEIVSAAYDLLKDLIKSKKMTPKLQLDNELNRGNHVEVDDRQVILVLTNLVLNAIDASTRGQPIDILTRNASEKEVSFSVRDYGMGIPLEVRRKIFEMFFTTKKGGFGVGLHVARELIRRHGGRIELDSKPGAGATFSVFLPKVK